MGYRSDVTMLFYANDAKDFPLFKLWFDENVRPALKEWLDVTPQEFERGEVKGYALHFNDVKWYDTYPDVQAIEEVWSRFDVTFNDNSTAYFGAERACIGEDYSDVSHDETYHTMNLLNIVRHAEY